MTPQLEALAMLNTMFESHDGRPVEQAILTRRDYAVLVQAFTSHYTVPDSPHKAVKEARQQLQWIAMQEDKAAWHEAKGEERIPCFLGIEYVKKCAEVYRALSSYVQRDVVIEEVAKAIEAAPLTYAGPDPQGIRDLRYLLVLTIRDMKGTK